MTMTSIKEMDLDHLIGQQLGTAVLLKELARGGMAAIFIAYQKTLKRQIAVKILPKSLFPPWAVDLFLQEAEAAAILSHPNIVPIYEVGEYKDFLFYTMQLVQGRSVAFYIQKIQKHILPSRRFFPLKASIQTIMAVLDALDYAHRQDIIHRDIKPANILIEEHTKRPIITDFGIAKLLRGPDLKIRKILGTPIYMAPEQAKDGEVDGRADIYATGVTFFEMLVSSLPLPDYDTGEELLRKKKAFKDRFFQRKPSEINSQLDPEIDEIIFKALWYEPEKRYATCREFLERLECYREHHFKK